MSIPRIESFEFPPGRRISRRYIIESLIGSGWEGEVYRVREEKTGVLRAVKFYFPHRNPGRLATIRYAKKLNKLRHCKIVTQYHLQDYIWNRGQRIDFLVADLFDGQLLSDFLSQQPGKRLHHFEALHLLHALAQGIKPIHRAREYHGDIHTGNILVRRAALSFDVKLVDFYHHGPSSAERIRGDVYDLIDVFYQVLGGQKHYAKLPRPIKRIILGRKTSLIDKRFRNAGALCDALDNMNWNP